MQSVALSDSCHQHEEDFVIVDALCEESDHVCDDDTADDESYDYCEDVYLVPSVVQSFVMTDNHALQTFHQEDFLDCPLPFNLNNEGEGAGGIEEAAERSGVNKIQKQGISMWPFEEANSSDDADIESVAGSVVASEISASEVSTSTQGDKESSRGRFHVKKDQAEQHVSNQASDTGGDNSSASSLSKSSSSAKRNGANVSSASSYNTTEHQYLCSITDGAVTGNDQAPTGDDSSVYSSTNSKVSRISNKKRRKQLKLAKKAAAAAAAAATLSHMSAVTSRSSPNRVSHSKKATRKLVGRVSNKKQVACATQTLASYREELSRSRNCKNINKIG